MVQVSLVKKQFRWLMEGLGIEQKSLILPAEKAASLKNYTKADKRDAKRKGKCNLLALIK